MSVLLHWMGLRTGRLRPTIVGAGLGAALTYRQASRQHQAPAIALAARHQVSGTVALHALEMLDANHYVSRSGRSGSYCVTWQATPEDNAAESRDLSRAAVDAP